MLWGCHPAAVLLGIGVLFRIRWLAEMGGLFHIAVGVLGYSIELCTARTTTIPSLIVHILGPLTGFIQIRRGGLDRAAPAHAMGYYLTLIVLSRYFTPPALNVNVVFTPYLWKGFYGAHPALLPVANGIQMAGLLWGGYFVLSRITGPR